MESSSPGRGKGVGRGVRRARAHRPVRPLRGAGLFTLTSPFFLLRRREDAPADWLKGLAGIGGREEEENEGGRPEGTDQGEAIEAAEIQFVLLLTRRPRPEPRARRPRVLVVRRPHRRRPQRAVVHREAPPRYGVRRLDW